MDGDRAGRTAGTDDGAVPLNLDIEVERAAFYSVSVKTKTGTRNGLGKEDRRYLALIDEYLGRIKEVRVEMKRSKAEIERLEVSFRRRMAEIDTLLKAC